MLENVSLDAMEEKGRDCKLEKNYGYKKKNGASRVAGSVVIAFFLVMQQRGFEDLHLKYISTYQSRRTVFKSSSHRKVFI